MRDPLYRDNIQVRYDVLVNALRDIKGMRTSAFRSYQEDCEAMRRIAAQALREAKESA
jgi:hypothetical protein